MSADDPSTGNGFELNGKHVPEIALEILLSFVPMEDILKLRQVCQVWNTIASRRSFWKEVFERNGRDWTAVPNHVKEKEKSWMILYSALKYRIFTKNFVQNPSGHSQFANWETVQDGGDGITVESPPVGIGPLPPDPDFEGEVDSAFLTSFGWSTIVQKIELGEAGLTSEIMKAMIPFQFVSKQMVGTRVDCGGIFCVSLCLLDVEGKAIIYNVSDALRNSGEDWIQASSSLNCVEEHGRIDEAKHLAVIISGKDSQFWGGHYGPKFSRISVGVRCINSEEAQSVVPNQLKVQNDQVPDFIFPYRHSFLGYDFCMDESDSAEYSEEENEDVIQEQ